MIDICFYEEEDLKEIEGVKFSFPKINIPLTFKKTKYVIRRCSYNVDRVTLIFSDMKFSIGGEHYYGRFEAPGCEMYNPKEEYTTNLPGYDLPEEYERFQFKVTKKITLKEAKYLNKKNSYLGGDYKKGQYVNMFDTPKEVVEMSKYYYDTYFDKSVKVKFNCYSGAYNEFAELFKKIFKMNVE